MVFSSPLFLFLFLPAVLFFYFLTPSLRLRNAILTLASLFFYAWGEAYYVAIMLLTIAMNYAFGLWIDRSRDPARRKRAVTVAIIANLGLLSFYKYANFFLGSLDEGLRVIHSGFQFWWTPVHLPIGISFFTFQALSYVIDVYRGVVKAQTSLEKLALYKSLFPQLIAGPIVRYVDIEKELGQRKTTWILFADGTQRFIIGLGKKALIANTLGRIADQVYGLPTSQISSALAWIGAVSYTFQIYFDFSGYSDMAIGLGRMFGFHFLENFNYPYISKSITEFWRRWHISLSTWFRDYLYIPLGGNRVSSSRNYLNLLIVFFLCGLWHGAAWHFVVWGLFHGGFLILERSGAGRVIHRWPVIIQRAYALLIILMGWVLFRAGSVREAGKHFRAMVGFAKGREVGLPLAQILTPEVLLCFGIAIVASTPVLPLIQKHSGAGVLFSGRIAALAILLICVMYLASGTYNPFIYFRF